MSASIYEVAQRAGVSISTVSRILNGSAAVSEKKTQAVQEALEFFQYEPNQFARGLVKKSSNMIEVYFLEKNGSMLNSSYSPELLKGIEQVLSRENYSLVLLSGSTGGTQRKQQIPRYLEYVRQKRIDGLILSGLNDRHVKQEVFRELMEENFPVVYIGKHIHEKGLDIYAQFEQYHVDMVHTLYQYGHRKILMFISRLHDHYLREITARVRMDLLDAALCPVVLDYGDFSREQVVQVVKECVFDAACTAITTEGLEDAQVLLSVCTELQISVPEQVSILSVEHQKGAGGLLVPAISAYFVPAQAMGSSAAESLVRLIRSVDIETPSIEYESVYIPRDSIRRL